MRPIQMQQLSMAEEKKSQTSRQALFPLYSLLSLFRPEYRMHDREVVSI